MRKQRVKKIVKRIAEKGKEVFVEKKENENIKIALKDDILSELKYSKEMQRFLEKYKFSISELEKLKIWVIKNGNKK